MANSTGVPFDSTGVVLWIVPKPGDLNGNGVDNVHQRPSGAAVRSLGLVYHTTPHDEADVLQRRDIRQRIRLNGNDVGRLARLDCANLT